MDTFNQRYWITKELASDLTELADTMYDPDDPAREVNNPKPLLERLGLKKPLSMQQKLERLFQKHRLEEQMMAQGEESPEEMADFHIQDEDQMPISPYEELLMQNDPFPSTNNRASLPQDPEGKTGTSNATEEQPEDSGDSNQGTQESSLNRPD